MVVFCHLYFIYCKISPFSLSPDAYVYDAPPDLLVELCRALHCCSTPSASCKLRPLYCFFDRSNPARAPCLLRPTDHYCAATLTEKIAPLFLGHIAACCYSCSVVSVCVSIHHLVTIIVSPVQVLFGMWTRTNHVLIGGPEPGLSSLTYLLQV